jgi:hypothetical protein
MINFTLEKSADSIFVTAMLSQVRLLLSSKTLSERSDFIENVIVPLTAKELKELNCFEYVKGVVEAENLQELSLRCEVWVENLNPKLYFGWTNNATDYMQTEPQSQRIFIQCNLINTGDKLMLLATN